MSKPSLRPGLRLRLALIGLDLELSAGALFSIAAIVSALVLVNSQQVLIIHAEPLSIEWRLFKSAEDDVALDRTWRRAAAGDAGHPLACEQGSPLAHVPPHEPP